MKKNTKKNNLTIYLMKDHVTNANDCINKEKFKNIQTIEFKSDNVTGTVFSFTSNEYPPKWKGFVLKLISPEALSIPEITSESIIIILTIKKRLMALSFGNGYYLLNDDEIETGFGKKVSLSLANPEKIKELQYYRMEKGINRMNEQTSFSGSTNNYGIDTETDILRRATVIPTDETYGKRLTGSDSLNISAEIDASSIVSFLEKLLEQYLSNGYSTNFAWIDNLNKLDDKEKVSELNQSLFTKISQGEIDKIGICPSDNIDWAKCTSFSIGLKNSPNNKWSTDIDPQAFFSSLKSKSNDEIEKVLGKICLLKKDSNDTIESLGNISRTLIWEKWDEKEKKQYARLNNIWYCISKELLEEINEFSKSIKKMGFTFPSFKENETEGEYNERISKDAKSGVILLDKKLFHINNNLNKLELCDLYQPSEHCFIHVKKDTVSSKLSHLFFQGLNSAEAFQTYSMAKQFIVDSLAKNNMNEDKNFVLNSNSSHDFYVSFLILSDTAKSFDDLPFFSKLSFKKTQNTLKAMNFNVSLDFVGMERKEKESLKVPDKPLK